MLKDQTQIGVTVGSRHVKRKRNIIRFTVSRCIHKNGLIPPFGILQHTRSRFAIDSPDRLGRTTGGLRKPKKDSLWWHYQVIIVPKHFSDDLGDKGYMQIEAGSNNGNPPNIQSNEDIDMAKVSLRFSSWLFSS